MKRIQIPISGNFEIKLNCDLSFVEAKEIDLLENRRSSKYKVHSLYFHVPKNLRQNKVIPIKKNLLDNEIDYRSLANQGKAN
jgi:hypothetical protein